MSFDTVQNPLSRLNTLPNTMNWRGGWDVSEQYYLNNIVSSPIDTFSYILTATSLLGGTDPSLSPEWTRLTPITGSGEITFVGQGDGIIVDETDPSIPVISNNGVITLTATNGLAINVGSPPQDPVIDNTGVLTLAVTTGLNNIGTAQEPHIVNTGVLSLAVGTGLSLISPTPNPSVTNIRNFKRYSLFPFDTFLAPGLQLGTTPPNNLLGYMILGGFQIPADAVPNSTAMIYNPNWSVDNWGDPANDVEYQYFFFNTTANFFFPQRINCFNSPAGNPNGIPLTISTVPHFPANQSSFDYIQQPQWIVLDNVNPNDNISVCVKFSSTAVYFSNPFIRLDYLLYKTNL